MPPPSFVQPASLLYRSSLVAADVLAAPTTSAASAVNGGSCTANTYNTKVVGVNAYGRTTPSTLRAATTATTNLTVRCPITQLVGATAYDIYCSTDADPKWVGRITEAQRLSGILLTAVGTTGAGGTANAVDVQVPGTGQLGGTTAAANTALAIPAAVIDSLGFQYVNFDLAMTGTGDAASLACSVLPLYLNDLDSTWYGGSVTALTFGGTAASYLPLQQRLQVETRGNRQVALCVVAISGTGASLSVRYTLT